LACEIQFAAFSNQELATLFAETADDGSTGHPVMTGHEDALVG